MVQEGIVLGHCISLEGLEGLMPPTTIKGVRSFLGHTRFYKRFIKDVSKFLDPCANYWKRMPHLILMRHVLRHFRSSNVD